jgi:malate dehydrogenase (oxaloacetate-decarboxylating)(NADP+)
MQAHIQRAGLRLQPGRDFEVVNPEDDPRHRAYSDDYHGLMGRQGITPEMAKAAVRRSNTLIAAMMIRRGDADAMLAGTVGRYDGHLEHVRDVIGLAPGAQTFAAMNVLMLGERTLFLTDTFVNEEPSAQQLAEIARMAAEEVRRFGRPAKVAFLSHSNFGSSTRGSAQHARPTS